MSESVWWTALGQHQRSIESFMLQHGGMHNGHVRMFRTYVNNLHGRGVSRMLEQAWHHAPDHATMRTHPGFAPLCDLLDGSLDNALRVG